PGELLPRLAAVLAAPHRRLPARTGARPRLERHHVDGVGIVRMDDDGKAEVRRQPLCDRPPGVPVVVAAEDADAGPSRRAAVVLGVEPPGRFGMAGDLVHALSPLGVRLGSEHHADALVLRRERLPAVLAQVVAAGRDADVYPPAVADD